MVSTVGFPSVTQHYIHKYSDWNFTVDWDRATKKERGWIEFGQTKSIMGIAFPRLIEYVDLDGNTMYDADNDTIVQSYDLREFKWNQMTLNVSRYTDSEYNATVVQFDASTRRNQTLAMNGTIAISFKVANQEIVVNDLTLNPNRTKVDLEILDMPRTENGTYFAVESYIVSSGSDEDNGENSGTDTSTFVSFGKSHFIDWQKTAFRTREARKMIRILSCAFANLDLAEIDAESGFGAVMGNRTDIHDLQKTFYTFSEDCYWDAITNPTDGQTLLCKGLQADENAKSSQICETHCCADPLCTVWEWSDYSSECKRGTILSSELVCQPDADANQTWAGGIKRPRVSTEPTVSGYWDPAVNYGELPNQEVPQPAPSTDANIAAIVGGVVGGIAAIGMASACFFKSAKDDAIKTKNSAFTGERETGDAVTPGDPSGGDYDRLGD